MPIPLGPLHELTDVNRPRRSSQRSRRNTDLGEAEDFRPQASPVDTFDGGDNQHGKVAFLGELQRALKSTADVTVQSLRFADPVELGRMEAGRVEAALAGVTSLQDALDAAPDEEAREAIRGQSRWYRRGYMEQLGATAHLRYSNEGLIDETIKAENQRRQLAEEKPLDPIEDKEGYNAFLAQHFQDLAEEDAAGDEDFMRGFAAGLPETLAREYDNRLGDAYAERNRQDALADTTLAREIADGVIRGKIKAKELSERINGRIKNKVALGKFDEEALRPHMVGALVEDFV